jgi:hypothetical protein
MGVVDTNPNANAALITGTQMQLEPADVNNPGVLNAVAQTIGGPKTFAAAPILSTGVYGVTPASSQMMTINASGTLGSQAIPPSGVLTMGVVDTNPNANAALITGTQMQLEPADVNHPGVLNAVAQTIGGPKTFAAAPILSTGVYGVTPASSQMMTINSSGALGSQVIPAGAVYSANPIGTNNVVLGTGTITAMTVRGVNNASPWPIIMDAIVAGNLVTLRIPQFSITSTTGGTGTAIIFSGTLPAGFRPTTAFFAQQILTVSSSTISNAVAYIQVNIFGVIAIVTDVTFTTTFGLFQDLVIQYFNN